MNSAVAPSIFTKNVESTNQPAPPADTPSRADADVGYELKPPFTSTTRNQLDTAIAPSIVTKHLKGTHHPASPTDKPSIADVDVVNECHEAIPTVDETELGEYNSRMKIHSHSNIS